MTKQTRREFLKKAGAAAASASVYAAMPGAWAAEAAEQKAKRPNILFFFPDQHRYDWLQSNSKLPVRTPHLSKLSARGVRFTQAICPSPLCAPSRACLAAGKEYSRCHVPSNSTDYPIDQATFYTLLRDSGYHVTGCGKFDLHKATPDWGPDGKRLIKEWGFSDGIDNAGKNDAVGNARSGRRDPYTAYLQTRRLLQTHIKDFGSRRGKQATFPTPLPDDAYCDNWVANNGLELIRKAPAGKPWFLQINFTGPHSPWDITESMDTLYRGVDFPQPNKGRALTSEEHAAVRRNYSAMVTNIDRWLGIYVDELRKRGELENTIIVYSSDHGEMLGDQGLWGKSVPFEPSIGVPLVIAGPGVSSGVVSDALVSTIDLAATFLELAEVPRPTDMDSRSLMPLMRKQTEKHRDYVLSALRPWRTVYDGRYKLVEGYETQDGQQGPMLFDMQSDPLENTNIADKSGDEVARLKAILDKGV